MQVFSFAEYQQIGFCGMGGLMGEAIQLEREIRVLGPFPEFRSVELEFRAQQTGQMSRRCVLEHLVSEPSHQVHDDQGGPTGKTIGRAR